MRTAGTALIFVLLTVGFVNSQEDGGQAMWSLGQVENQVAPIALYPDPLVANVLDACTNPGAIVQASDYINQPQASRGSPPASLPASVQALVNYPSVLHMLDAQLSWATRLGQTFQAQPKTVHDAINSIRQQAQTAGNLVSNQYQSVVVSNGVYGISAVNPNDYWVPYYDPAEIYDPGYAYAWRRGFVQGYCWQGHATPYHPYAHPYHPAYTPAYHPAYNYGGYHPSYHQSYDSRAFEGGGFERGFGGGFRGGFRR
ncbi:MAG TPA: DUF3300 domain-containing protein [Planctomycetota bacterium]|nr:DUF3300 domain-containing protein [Planctomycetota bacterium]